MTNFAFELLGLSQGEDFRHLVECSKTSRKNDQSLRQIRKPKLAHEEVVEFKAQFRGDVRIRALFERQADVESDCFAASFASAAISGFHDARPTART